jgi:hypothetical protein
MTNGLIIIQQGVITNSAPLSEHHLVSDCIESARITSYQQVIHYAIVESVDKALTSLPKVMYTSGGA